MHRQLLRLCGLIGQDGKPHLNQNEEEAPVVTTFLNDYVRTKVQGERMVVAANGPKLLTCALRPGHLYGERAVYCELLGSVGMI